MEEKKSLKKKLMKFLPVILFGIIAAVVVVIVVISSLKAKDEIEEYSIKNENVYMIIGESKIEYEGEMILDHSGDVTKLNVGEEDAIELENEPLYFTSKKEVIFPSAMSVVFPTNGMKQNKVNYYSLINGEGIQPIIKNTDLNYALAGCFLYDGYDIYFFIEDTTIKFGENEIKVTPLSFARVSYSGGDVTIYDYETDTAMMYTDIRDYVYANTENYSINMSLDSVSSGDNSVLLIQKINSLNNLK